MTETDHCPDCGCPVDQHTAVIRASIGTVSYCGNCGTCPASTATPFTQAVRDWLDLIGSPGQRPPMRHARDR